MTFIKDVRSERLLMGRLSRGGDLLGELMDVCGREKISLGRVEVIGAVERARLGYYHQVSKEYRTLALNEPLEIASFQGNISVRDDGPFVHAHITLANERGMTFGGHLLSGSVVFAAEFIIETFTGPSFVRTFDEDTGLHLWQKTGEAS
jgi:predicted DNA-binding protein with PD1-like motif